MNSSCPTSGYAEFEVSYPFVIGHYSKLDPMNLTPGQPRETCNFQFRRFAYEHRPQYHGHWPCQLASLSAMRCKLFGYRKMLLLHSVSWRLPTLNLTIASRLNTGFQRKEEENTPSHCRQVNFPHILVMSLILMTAMEHSIYIKLPLL